MHKMQYFLDTFKGHEINRFFKFLLLFIIILFERKKAQGLLYRSGQYAAFELLVGKGPNTASGIAITILFF